MKKSLYILAAIACFVFSFTPDKSQAQVIGDNSIFFHSFHQPMANKLNPTMFPTRSGWYVSLPRIDMMLALPLSYNDLGLQYDPQRDATVLNLNHLLDQVRGNKLGFRMAMDFDLLGFGVRLNEFASIHMSSGVRTTGHFSIPTGVLEFLADGNAGEVKEMDFGQQKLLSAHAYAYVSLGGGWHLPELPISIGARVNLLNGIQTMAVDNLSLQMTTAEDISNVRMRSDFMVHSAGLLGFGMDEDGQLQTNTELRMPNNWGVSMDLGVRAKLGMFDLSLSLLDLGQGIYWKDNAITLVPKSQERSVSFDGLELTDLLHGGSVDTTFLSQMRDSLSNMISYTTKDGYYWSGLPTRMFFGASATVLDMLKVGYLFHGEWDKGALKTTFRCNNTLSAHANLMNWLELTVANSFTFDGRKMDFFNPGASITISTAALIQFYIAADYVSNMYLTNLRAGHIYLGLNIVGRK